ncbi:4-oxalocrotonate tautomerase family protein [Actinosynnema sp. NPDC020468]|uniref:tautomerase family protein n=1 Tax=Actinosynnema sp. NPDC020468 TaxID=3154488 RepID=UPI0033E5A37D
MPQIHVTVLRGRSREQIADLGAELTAATVRALGVPAEAVKVVVTEAEPEHWFVGGESMARRRAEGR